MKKSDLKTGMLFQYSNGGIGMVINDFLIREGGYSIIRNFNEDLTHNDRGLDVKKVSKVLDTNLLMPKNWTEENLKKYLLWECKPEKTYELDGIEYSESTLRSIIKKATE